MPVLSGLLIEASDDGLVLSTFDYETSARATLSAEVSDEGKALLRQWGIEGDWVGVGHCILGYPAADPKPAAPRKPDYIVKV